MKEFHEAANEFERNYTGQNSNKEHWDDDDLNHAFVMGCIFGEIKNKDLADRMACFLKNHLYFFHDNQKKDASELVDQWFDKNGR